MTHHPTRQVIHYDWLLWRNWKQHQVYAKSLWTTSSPARSSTMTGFSGGTENSIRYFAKSRLSDDAYFNELVQIIAKKIQFF